jgi:hypothetical protein
VGCLLGFITVIKTWPSSPACKTNSLSTASEDAWVLLLIRFNCNEHVSRFEPMHYVPPLCMVNDSTSCCMRSICIREDDSFLHIGAVLKKFMRGRQWVQGWMRYATSSLHHWVRLLHAGLGCNC